MALIVAVFVLWMLVSVALFLGVLIREMGGRK